MTSRRQPDHGPTEEVLPASSSGGPSVEPVREPQIGLDDTLEVNDLAPGSMIVSRYRIVRRIGEGGFADVYEAEDREAGRNVALKILHQVDGAKRKLTLRKRFILEAELVAQIDHPDIVDLYDFGVTDDGRLFISLELLRGITLEDTLFEHGALEVGRAVKLVVRALGALQAAHDLGVVHRDLKPSNLFIEDAGTANERLRILDFGIAFVADDPGNRMTRTGQINGTPQYLAPEYIQQQVVTTALDVYQMALILVEMTTGLQVVRNDNPYKCLMAHVSALLDLPEQLMASEIGPVIRRALERNHEKRYPDAASFQKALAPLQYVADNLVVTFDPNRPKRPPKMRSSHSLPVQIEVVRQGLRSMNREAMLGDTQSAEVPVPQTLSPPKPRPKTPASVEAPALPPPSRRRKEGIPPSLIALGVAAGLLIGLLAVGMYIVAFGETDSPKDATVTTSLSDEVATAALSPNGDEPVPSDEAEAAGDDDEDESVANETMPPPSRVEEAESIEVRVAARPGGAELFRGEDTIGEGTAVVAFDTEEDEPVEIRVAMEGYEEATVRVGPQDGPVVDVELAKIEDKPAPRNRRRNRRGKKPDKKKKKLGFFE